jgi:hypothetical protein
VSERLRSSRIRASQTTFDFEPLAPSAIFSRPAVAGRPPFLLMLLEMIRELV